MHCRMLSKVAKSHHQSPKFAISCHELSKVVKSCCQKLVKVVKSWQKLSLFLGIVGGLNGFYGNGLIVGGFNGFYGKRVIVGGFNGF